MTETRVKRGRPRKSEIPANVSPNQSIGFSESEHQHDSAPEDTPRVVRERKPRQVRDNSKEQLEEIEGMLRLSAGMICGIVAPLSQDDAVVIAKHTIAPPDVNSYTPNLIDATMQLARQDRKVRVYLAGLASQGVYLNVAVAFGSMTLGIMANHKLIPPMFNPTVHTSPKATEVHENGVSSMG